MHVLSTLTVKHLMSQNISGQGRIVYHFCTEEFPFSAQTQMKYWFSNQRNGHLKTPAGEASL